jgi:hypothetical protein
VVLIILPLVIHSAISIATAYRLDDQVVAVWVPVVLSVQTHPRTLPATYPIGTSTPEGPEAYRLPLYSAKVIGTYIHVVCIHLVWDRQQS